MNTLRNTEIKANIKKKVLSVNFHVCSLSRPRQTSRQLTSAHMPQHLWSHYFNSCSDQMFAFIYNRYLPNTPKHGTINITPQGKVMGTSKSVILEDERSELMSHLASYAREIHLSRYGRRQIWKFSARESTSPLKQHCELGDRFSGHWMRRWSLFTCPLCSSDWTPDFAGMCMGSQYWQWDKHHRSHKLLKLCLHRCCDM